MPDSLSFAGGSDRIEFSQGRFAGTGAFSMACVAKRTSAAEATYAFLLRFDGTATDSLVLGLVEQGGGTNHGFSTFDGATERTVSAGSLPFAVPLNEWFLFGISKAAGIATPRLHVYQFSSDTWGHVNFSGTLPNYPAIDGFSWASASSESFQGNILIGAVWDSALSDGQFETLESVSGWVAADPDELHRFNKTTGITPRGIGAQTLLSGATLDTGDAPAEWVEDLDVFPIASAADDGTGFRQHATYASIGSGGYTADDGGSLWVSKTESDVYYVDNSFLRFGTSSIPDGVTITEAMLRLHVLGGQHQASGLDYHVTGDYYDFGGEPSVAGDWILSASPSILDPADTDIDTVGAATGNVYEFGLIDLTGISQTGFTGIRLTLNNIEPTADTNNVIEFAAQEHATQVEPRFVVVWTTEEPPGEAPTFRLVPPMIV